MVNYAMVVVLGSNEVCAFQSRCTSHHLEAHVDVFTNPFNDVCVGRRNDASFVSDADVYCFTGYWLSNDSVSVSDKAVTCIVC